MGISCVQIAMKCVFGVLLVIPAYQAALGRLKPIPTDRDLTTEDCQNFNFSSSNRAFLPSEVISISGVCDDTRDTKALCPSWNIVSPLAEVRFLRNDTVRDGTTCIHVMEIQVLKFKDSTKRVKILVEFEHPKSEPIKEIDVERSDDGEFCQQSRDCYYSDQFCSPSGICTCSNGWIFIRNVRICVPAITRIKGRCTYQEQCQIANSLCQYSGCECRRFYNPRVNDTQCTPEGRSYRESCETDENCLIEDVNTMCKDGSCYCKEGYTYEYGKDRKCLPNGRSYGESCETDENCLRENVNTMCKNGSCDCKEGYTYEYGKDRKCLQNGRSYGESCETDENCLRENVNTMCKNGSCDCKEGYTYEYGKDRKCLLNGSASFKTGFGWNMIFFIVTLQLLNIL